MYLMLRLLSKMQVFVNRKCRIAKNFPKKKTAILFGSYNRITRVKFSAVASRNGRNLGYS